METDIDPLVYGQPVSASAVPNYWDPALSCKELTLDEVERLGKAFGEAAVKQHCGSQSKGQRWR